ncbi:MAG: c-type cytochrome, partial [Bacteriovoracaceae bacterium]|nr:c-type cytochrome [Bacteriovoracaceae bacterium]
MKHEPGMAYNTKKLNKIFAILSLVFLFSVLWMFLSDYIRPWKAVQIKALQVKKEVLTEQIQTEEKSLDQKKIDEIHALIAKGEEVVITRKKDLSALENDLNNLQGKIYATKIRRGLLGADVSALTFQYESANEHGKSSAPKLKKELDDKIIQFSAIKSKSLDLDEERKALNVKISDIMKDKIQAEKELDQLVGKKERLLAAREKTDLGLIGVLRNLPFIDFMDPTIKIQQVVLNNISDDRYFQQVPKVDRCTTCHTFIDQAGFEKKENPYKTHPKLDMMVGVNSPHPYKSFGCTTCHGGEGHRVNDFNSIAHTPRSVKQQKDWEKKHGWHEPHKVSQPMFPLQHTEAACLKCHQGVERVPQALTLNKGRDLIQKNGCYGCHKIKGWEHMAKPGPSLANFKGKFTKEFLKNWIWDPKEFNPKSKMPSFFAQSNNSAPEFMRRNIAEVNAMAEYLWEKTKVYTPFKKFISGDVDKGKELIATVGCIGCHQVAGLNEPQSKTAAWFGPALEGLGSKLDKDFLISWLKKPSHYSKTTAMPSLRLTDEEASHITAFLLDSKNKKFEELRFDNMDTKIRDELIMMYFSEFDTKAVAETKLAKMSDTEKTMELGFRSIGKYGCFS